MPTWLKDAGLEDREIELRDENENHIGDLIFAKDHVLWCKGRTHRGNGRQLSYDAFAGLLDGNEE